MIKTTTQISRPALLAVILALPVAILYGAHYLHGWRFPNLYPTGFLLYDMPYYMSNAREFFDQGVVNLSYGNPFSEDPATPRIYSQPHLFLWGVVQSLTGWEPGTVLTVFAVLFGAVFAWVVTRFFASQFRLHSASRVTALVVLMWGGGLLFLGGVAATIFEGEKAWSLDYDVLRFDPCFGWWFLNLGRNLAYPTESYYHILVFLAAHMALSGREKSALVSLAVLSWSHPFTGIQFLLVFSCWSLSERLFFRSGAVSWVLPVGTVVLLGAHIGYYLGFLPGFPEHAVLMEKWTQNLNLPLPTILLGYLLAAGALALRLRSRGVRVLVGVPRDRLFLAWFLISFALANHDLIMTARQPIHFTRGYIFSSLVLLGMPAWIVLARKLQGLRGIGRAVAWPLMAILVFGDNLAWFAARSLPPTGMFITRDMREVLESLEGDPRMGPATLLVSNEVEESSFNTQYLAYLATAFLPVRSWHSHIYNTPEYDAKEAAALEFFRSGKEPPGWRDRDLFIVLDKDRAPGNLVDPLRDGFGRVLENGRYWVGFRARSGSFSGR